MTNKEREHLDDDVNDFTSESGSAESDGDESGDKKKSQASIDIEGKRNAGTKDGAMSPLSPGSALSKSLASSRLTNIAP